MSGKSDQDRLDDVLTATFPDEPSPTGSKRGSLGLGQSVSSGGSSAFLQMPELSTADVRQATAVRMRGSMYKRPPESGLAGVARLFAAEWRLRFFALVAFEKQEQRDQVRLDLSERRALAAHEPSAGPARRRIAQTLSSQGLPESELLLCWFASTEAFDSWMSRLTPSTLLPGCYELDVEESPRSPGARRPSFLARGGSAPMLATDVSECLGSLALSTVSSVREALRMDLQYRTLELAAPGRTFYLGVEELDQFIAWRDALGAALTDGAGERQSMTGRLRTPRASRATVSRSTTTRMLAARERPNNWVYEVPLRTFHFFWYVLFVWSLLWIFVLVFLMNPMIAPCDRGAQTNASGGTCYDLETDEPLTGCAGWEEAAEQMGPVFSWVARLQPSGLFSRHLQLTGAQQDCFQLPSVLVQVLFWLFVLCELVTGYSTLVASRLNWRVVRRGARMLHEMEPDFPRAHWPRVDLLICHYGEPAEETVETLKCALAQEYEPSKLHIYVCDDGYYKTDFAAVDAGGAHWPTAKTNRGLLQSTGDVREAVRSFMTSLAAERGSATHGDEGRLAATTRSVMPNPQSASRVVARLDCALGFTEDRYEVKGLPTVSFVARLKPRAHHSKAGNINNVLYNVQCTGLDGEAATGYDGGAYCAIFDNDMEPHRLFLLSTLPLFFEPLTDGAGADDAHLPPMLTAAGHEGAPYSDAPERNAHAYVQTPQYFKRNELMLAVGGDPLSHENSTFMDSALPGMDGYDSVMFVGTNVTWRREALDSIGGLQYGTVSEDFWTGHHAHWLGWKSAYLRKDHYGPLSERFRLAQGTVPPNVAASLAQRKRWHKGGVELLLGVDNPRDPQWQLPPHRLPPPAAVPAHVRRYRRLHWFFARTSWMTSTFPPVFYTVVVIITSWTDAIWVYLNPLPTLCILLPRLFLASFVSTIADAASVDAKRILAGLPEFFTYAPVRLVATRERASQKGARRAVVLQRGARAATHHGRTPRRPAFCARQAGGVLLQGHRQAGQVGQHGGHRQRLDRRAAHRPLRASPGRQPDALARPLLVCRQEHARLRRPAHLGVWNQPPDHLLALCSSQHPRVARLVLRLPGWPPRLPVAHAGLRHWLRGRDAGPR